MRKKVGLALGAGSAKGFAHIGILQALDEAGGVVARAAERLRIRRTTLVEKMRKYGMNRRDDDEQSDD